MTYKLQPGIEKIVYPVFLIFPDGTKREYRIGRDAVQDAFDQKYLVESLKAVNSTIEILLKNQTNPSMHWIGEEAESFF